MISHKCPQSQTRNGDETPSDRHSIISRRQETIWHDGGGTENESPHGVVHCILIHLTTGNVFTDC